MEIWFHPSKALNAIAKNAAMFRQDTREQLAAQLKLPNTLGHLKEVREKTALATAP